MTSVRVTIFSSMALLATGVQPTALDAAARSESRARTPVLVELFTSEGCSSCPPADQILARLIAEQPVTGAEVIALGFHVDYWNRLGWRDAFSSMAYTTRQQEYAGPRQDARVYTPQLVVDGTHKFVGSDWSAANRFILEAASTPKLTVAIDVPSGTTDSARVPIRVDVQPSPEHTASSDVMLAVTEDGLVSDVKRGENANRRLSHVAVVRSLERIGRVDPRQGFTLTRDVRPDPNWRRDAVKVVAFVQDRSTRRVLGIAARRLS